jgi:hypothetical protein
MALLAMVAACGDSGSSGETTTPATTTTTTAVTTTASTTTTSSTTTSTTAPKKKVGQITNLQPDGGRVDGALAKTKGPLNAGSRLTTAATGLVDFELDKKLKSCRVWPDSAVKVQPTSDVLATFEQGTFQCSTTASGALATFTLDDGRTFSASDPVFNLRVGTDGAATLEVVQGFIAVPRRQGGPAVLGAGQRAALVAGGVDEVGPFNIKDLPTGPRNEQATAAGLVNNVVSELSALRYPEIDKLQSATFKRVLANGVLRIGVTETRASGDIAAMARDAFEGEFLPQWTKTPLKVKVTTVNAIDAVDPAKFDLLLVPAGSQSGLVPFVQDDDGQVWSFVHQDKDDDVAKVLQSSMKVLLVGSCVNGNGRLTYAAPEPSCYDDLHGRSLQTIPTPLDAFGGLLGLPG